MKYNANIDANGLHIATIQDKTYADSWFEDNFLDDTKEETVLIVDNNDDILPF